MTDSAPPQDRLAGLSREQRAHLFEQIRRRKEKERATGPPDRIPRRPPGLDPIPLSFAQERLWFIDRLQPGLTAYNVPQALLIAGEISPAVFAAVLGEVVRRHEALRTTFREVDGRPAQVIAPAGGWTLPLIDLAALPAGLREAQARRLAQEEAERPFDLERGPLLRATLLRLAPAGHALLLDMHHIVSDGWSIGVLVREITALYGAAATGAPSPLPELPVQYADFAVWQRGWLRGEELERQISYWRQALAGAPASLELPADRPLPAERTYAGGRLHAPFGPAFTRGLALLARRHEATPFMVLLAGFQALLTRMTGSEDLTVGSPIANRNRAEIEPLIGFFVNTLVLRGDLAGDPTFRELIGRVRKTTLEAYSHQDLPFEQLVEELKPERRLAANPLFQVLFAVQNAPMGAIDLPGLSLAPLEFDMRVAQFDLELSFWDLAEGLAADLIYSTERFDPATALRLAGHLETLLQGLMADPGRRVSEAPLLSAAERQQLVREWNDTGRAIAGPPLAHQIVARQAALTPDTVAVEHGEERLSYRELAARAGRLAGVLRAAGVGADVPVALWVGRSLALPVGVLAVLEAGGACLPLDPSYPAERLALMIADAGPRLVVAEKGVLGELPPGLDAVVLDEHGETAAAAPDSMPGPAVDPENLAYILYTSGSTGRPKGVALTHRAVVNLALWAGSARPERGRRVLQFSPLSFDVSFEEMLSTWASGGALVLMPEEMRRDPDALLDFLIEKRIERLFQPFVALQQLAEAAREQGRTPPDLRELVTAGEQLRVTPAVAALCQGGARLFNEYGPTETHVTTAFLLRGEPGGWPALPPIGRPIANHRILLLDRGRLPVPLGLPGELCVGGAGLARGYFRRPDLTADRFIPDPGGTEPGARLYRTGDLARWTAGGDLEYLGRTDFQVKVRGYRVEPGEVEAAVAAHPGVRDAAVVARQDPPGGLRLVAYVVWDGEGSSEAGLREALKARLPAAMVPAAFVELAALPLTPSGKVDRRALAGPAFAPQGAEAASGYVEPATDTQRELAAIWSEILGVERVGAGDDFFDLGGHSLLAVQVLSRLRGRLGVELPVRALFEAPTLAGLARLADQAGALTEGGPRPRPAGEPAPLSFGQERLWFLDRMEPGNTAFNMGSSLRLRGRLDPSALERAVNEIVRRHEALRATFVEVDGRPLQRTLPALRIPLPAIDLSALAMAAREAEAARVARASLAAPFNLRTGPLVRTSLLRLAPDLHLFLLDVHHIVSDGWSAGVMNRELIALYDAFLAGRPSPLPPLPIQYGDFARWQREWLTGETLEAQLAYWRGKLGGDPAPLDLPTDRPRPALQTFRGGSLELEVPEATARALRRLSREQGASLFMTLLAGFQALLARLAGQEDVVVGTPIAGRRHPETEGLIGFFLNTLALRTDLSGNPTFRELLARVRETTLSSYEHQDIPFEALLAELKPERDLSRTPLFQVFFNMLNLPPEGERLPGLEIEWGPAPAPESKFDLTLYAGEGMGAIHVHLVYNADLFDEPRMAELLRQYRLVLERAARQPDGRILSFSLVTPEAAAVLPDPARPLGAEWHGAVHELFLAAARRYPERTAVVDPQGSWTYGELAGAAGRLAAGLRAAGLEPGDRVAIWAHRSAPVAWAVLGALAAGGAFVMLDPAYPAARLIEILRLAGPRAWVALADAGAPPPEVEELLAGWEAEGDLLGRWVLPGGGPAAGGGPLPGPRTSRSWRSPPGRPEPPRGSSGATARCRTSSPGSANASGSRRPTATACSPGWRTIRCSAISSPRSPPAPRSASPTRRRSSSQAAWRPGRRGRGSPSPT
jgi:amino acid adenylation domain-containing protein